MRVNTITIPSCRSGEVCANRLMAKTPLATEDARAEPFSVNEVV